MRLVTAVSLIASSFLALAMTTGCVPPSPPQAPPASNNIPEPPATGPVLTRQSAFQFEPGTRWEYTAIASEGLSIVIPLRGPWNLVPDSSVTATDYANEVVPIADAPLPDEFSDAGFAVKSTDKKTGDELYLYRGLTDLALLGYGRAEKSEGGDWIPTKYEPPTVSYPFGLEVGDTVTVREGKDFKIEATAVSESQARTPAGIFKRALLVRYDFTKPDNTSAGPSVYWILAPGVDWVAYIVPRDQLKPDSDIGGIVQIDIITAAPTK